MAADLAGYLVVMLIGKLGSETDEKMVVVLVVN